MLVGVKNAGPGLCAFLLFFAKADDQYSSIAKNTSVTQNSPALSTG